MRPLIRKAFGGALIVNGGYERETAEAVIASGKADLVSFATPFISNQDLIERFRLGASLQPGDEATFHSGGTGATSTIPHSQMPAMAKAAIGDDEIGSARFAAVVAIVRLLRRGYACASADAFTGSRDVCAQRLPSTQLSVDIAFRRLLICLSDRIHLIVSTSPAGQVRGSRFGGLMDRVLILLCVAVKRVCR